MHSSGSWGLNLLNVFWHLSLYLVQAFTNILNFLRLNNSFLLHSPNTFLNLIQLRINFIFIFLNPIQRFFNLLLSHLRFHNLFFRLWSLNLWLWALNWGFLFSYWNYFSWSIHFLTIFKTFYKFIFYELVLKRKA